ncbi:MAG: hypothetical protein JRI23_13845 [Deltaproteobacteria bacterium]|jgi:predicted CXXCH cytochrome family protein|nr:hypothetical protein [Deltaproteobacteria bacterium]MBW2532812.1 hypothetical protein [Deltaproteobacteria bacterium]
MKAAHGMAPFDPRNPKRLELGGALAAIAVAAAAGCSTPAAHDAEPVRTSGAAMVEIALPQQVDGRWVPLRRPAVEFDHRLHTTAMPDQGCETCHPRKTTDLSSAVEAPLAYQVGKAQGTDDRDELMNFYHELCIGCHRERASAGQASGAVACGDCHAARPAAESARAEMGFDYSLHHRHNQAEEEQCATCHHTERDPATGELVHESGAEDSCRSCHDADEEQGRSTLRAAVHQDCVGCHAERVGKGNEAGPVMCVGCHDSGALAKIERVDDPPMPDVGQPTSTWIHAAGAKSNLVPFDHAAHQPRADSCSGCHHRQLNACSDCHTVTGAPEGMDVTLEDAFHSGSVSYSCVGCHQRTAHTANCAGCHASLGPSPTESSCVRCHSGPPASAGPPAGAPKLPPVELAPLPDESDDFPTTVVIDSLAEHYTPSTFPHRQIVMALDKISRESKLATRFHGTTDTLCAGCHHESPLGTRPPPCSSCHGQSAHPESDMPSLKGAYHRQCIGCHQQMAIEPQGCTEGCHEAARKEVRP